MTVWTSDHGWQEEKAGVRRPEFAFQIPPGEPPAKAEVQYWKWPVYEPGNIEACTASAVAAAIELSQGKAHSSAGFRPSIPFIYYVARYLQKKEDEDAGSSIYQALRGCFAFGFPPDADWRVSRNLTAMEKPSAQVELNARARGITGFSHLDRGRLGPDEVLRGCKAAIALGYPVIFGASVDAKFLAGEFVDTDAIRVPYADDAPHRHAMLMVRYDDAGQGFFWVRDSLGADRGENGYLRIPYQYILDEKLSDDFWIITGGSFGDEPDPGLLSNRAKFWEHAAQFAQLVHVAYDALPHPRPSAARSSLGLEFPPKLSA